MTATAPKKMAFLITSTGWGGLEMNVAKLARAFSKKGHEVTLVSQASSTLVKNATADFHDVILIERKRKYFDLGAAKKISQSLKSREIGLVMVCDNRDLDMMCWAKMIYSADVTIVYHQQMQIGIDKSGFLHTMRYKTIDLWIAPLPYLKTEVGERTKFPVEKVSLVPLCVDMDRFNPKKYEQTEAREVLNLDVDVPLIGIIGRISEKKGQRFMVEAIDSLRQDGVPVELLVFGSATVNDPECQAYDASMRRYVKEKGLEDVIHFRPHQQDVALFYNAVDVFALGSHSETFGMVTVEAMLAELPIIATHSGGTSDLLDHGDLGQLYTYENLLEFKEGLKFLVNDMETAKEMGKRARDKALTQYTLPNEVSGILAAMASL